MGLGNLDRVKTALQVGADQLLEEDLDVILLDWSGHRLQPVLDLDEPLAGWNFYLRPEISSAHYYPQPGRHSSNGAAFPLAEWEFLLKQVCVSGRQGGHSYPNSSTFRTLKNWRGI